MKILINAKLKGCTEKMKTYIEVDHISAILMLKKYEEPEAPQDPEAPAILQECEILLTIGFVLVCDVTPDILRILENRQVPNPFNTETIETSENLAETADKQVVRKSK